MTSKVVGNNAVKKQKVASSKPATTSTAAVVEAITDVYQNASTPRVINVDTENIHDDTPTPKSSGKKKVVVTRRVVRKKDGTIISSTTTRTVVSESSPSPSNAVTVADKSTKSSLVVPVAPLPRKKLTGWEWYKSIGSPRFVLSPMVGQSELPFRMLCRSHSAQLAYTPMFIASRFVESDAYRRAVWQTCPEDRPLVVQFCGNDPELIVRAAKIVQKDCDAIDINLGCPQEVARRGNYGSYLMDNMPLVEKIVKAASSNLDVPVTVKIRVFDSFKQTLSYCKMLQAAGASMITIHGRQRHHREEVMADWTAAHRIRPHLNIPVIVNGDLWHAEDIAMCLDEAEVDGYMSAQGILHNPALFEPLATATIPLPPQPKPQQELALSAAHVQKLENSLKAAASSRTGDQFSWLPPVTESALRQRRPIGAIMSHALAFAYNHPLNKQEAASRPDTKGKIADQFRTPFATPQDAERQFNLAAEYVEWIGKYPVSHPSIARRHLFFMMFDNFQANLDQYDLLCEAEECVEYERIITILRSRAFEGKTVKMKETFGEGTRPRARRRDGTIAPPAWPVGGGGMNTENSDNRNGKTAKNAKNDKGGKNQQRGTDPYDAIDDGFEVIGKKGSAKHVQSLPKNGKKGSKGAKRSAEDFGSAPPQDSGLDKNRLRNVDLSKFD